jgi:hypothetical protein
LELLDELCAERGVTPEVFEFDGIRKLDAATLASELGPESDDTYVELRAELWVLTMSSRGAGVGDVTMMLGIEGSEGF